MFSSLYLVFRFLLPVGGIKLKMNFHETYWVPGIRAEDAGRVEDPTSMLRPCKNPAGVRSLVIAKSNGKCLEEELLYYQSVLPKFDVF